MRCCRVGPSLWLALAFWLAGAPSAVARQAAEPAAGTALAPAAPTPEPTPAAIPAAEIPALAERTAAELRRIEAAVEPRADVDAVAAALARRAPRLQQLRGELDRLDVDRVSSRRLDDLRLDWSQLQLELSEWQARLDDRWKGLQQIREQLDRRAGQWRATREAAGAEAVPPELLERIATIEAELERAELRVRARADSVARMIERAAEERDATEAALERLDELAGSLRSRLLRRDAAPLWEAAAWGRVEGLGVEARQAQRRWLATLASFASERLGELLLFAGLLAVLGFAALALRRRSRSWPPDDPARAVARHVVARPLAAALAFSLAGWLLLVGALPSAVQDAIGLLAVYPVLRLGVGLVSPLMRPLLVGCVALSLLERLWSLSPDGSKLARLLLLSGALLALAGARLVLRRWQRAEASAWSSAVRVALRLAALLLGASALANALGWLTLAQLLSTATLQSAFSGVAWLVVVRAAEALLPLIGAGAPGRRWDLLQRQASRLEGFARGAVALTAAGFWLLGTLDRFELALPLRERAAAWLDASLGLGGLEVSLGALLSAFVVLVLLVPFARVMQLVLREELLPRLQLPAGADHSVLTLANYALIGLGLLLAAGAAGLGSTQLAVVFGALSVGIGFGLQNIVNNFVSGLILMFERPIKVGDRIETAAHLGIVMRIGIRSSTVRSLDGAEVVVPNGDLISKEVINWTLSDQVRRTEVLVGVAYGSDPHAVREVLLEAARQHPRVLDEPEPVALMVGFGDSSLNFRLLVWARVEEAVVVGGEMHLAVHDGLKRAGIQIPFPQRDLHIRTPGGGARLG